MIDPSATIAASPVFAAFATALRDRRRVVAAGASGSSTTFLCAALARALARPVILLLAHLDDADEAADELGSFGHDCLRLPALEALPGETSASLELFAERLSVIREAIALEDRAPVIACPIPALMQSVPVPARLEKLSRVLRPGDTVRLGDLITWLDSAGYRRVDAVEEPGDFALRGGILDVFPPGVPTPLFDESTASGAPADAPARTDRPARPRLVSGVPVRIDFFGDEIERINEIDPGTMGSDRALPKGAGIQLVSADLKNILLDEGSCSFLDLLPKNSVAVIAETLEVVEQGRGYFERLTDSKGVYGPPAVLRLLETRFHALAEVNQFSAGASAADVRLDLPVRALPPFDKDVARAVGELAELSTVDTDGTLRDRTLVCCQNAGELQRLGELITQFATSARGIDRQVSYVHRGFIWDADPSSNDTPSNDTQSANPALRHSATPPLPSTLSVVPYHELLNRFTTRRRAARLRGGKALDTFLDFQIGDHVVHADHGIAHFVGLTTMKPRELPGRAELFPAESAETEEYLTLEFAGRAKLHVPATQIDKIQKYIGGFSGKPPLSTLGGARWKSQKEKAAESVRDLAGELLRVRAAREHMPGVAFPADTAWQNEFEAEFPYDETEDQLAALAEIKKDMSSARPMDRLICGDVGFGKTELAIRAAFKAAEFGKQVAVLVPTTVLAEQHERTFRSRFAGYPFKIESISRFKSDAEAKLVLQEVKAGRVDVLIGTHRILSQDVHFADLGLVIVDEEQRFGVEHKESLLRLRLTVDVLTLSATPIPRTLHMAMLGIRDISSLATPPLDRRAIVTEVIPYNARRIQQAITRELAREGQVFFVHNRISDIRSVADDIQKLAPDARIVVGHGQMPPHELEDVMLKFLRGRRAGGADILVSTTIIESGIDIASANTMIINNADRFGLADLHQLRGRVGRSRHRAYCYLLLPSDGTPREVARKRLQAIEQYSMLGAGFKIAMRDLEIRGAGNILGAEQSGHIAAVGYEMYCQLLERAVKELGNEKPPEPASSTTIEIGIPAGIPKSYIPSDNRRLEAYRRLATALSLQDLARFRSDLAEAYGEPPKQARRLADLAEIRLALAGLGVKTVTIRGKDVVFIAPDPAPAASAMRSNLKQGTVTVLPGKDAAAPSEIYFRPPTAYFDGETLLAIFRRAFLPGTFVESPAAPSAPGSAGGPTRSGASRARNSASGSRPKRISPE